MCHDGVSELSCGELKIDFLQKALVWQWEFECERKRKVDNDACHGVERVESFDSVCLEAVCDERLPRKRGLSVKNMASFGEKSANIVMKSASWRQVVSTDG